MTEDVPLFNSKHLNSVRFWSQATNGVNPTWLLFRHPDELSTGDVAFRFEPCCVTPRLNAHIISVVIGGSEA
jgi:hypothetical protein